MVTIVPTRLHWIGDHGEDDPNDFCAHSTVAMAIDDQQIVSPHDGDWTVSASAIILLRSLFADHPGDMQREEHVFPCCGHVIWPRDGGGVVISGCPNGVDFGIRHRSGHIELETSAGVLQVGSDDWRAAVLEFASCVRRFYEDSEPKDLSPDAEPEGYLAMMAEWDELAVRAQQASATNR